MKAQIQMEDIRNNADITPHRNDIRNIADIPELSEMPAVDLEKERFKIWKEIKIGR
jgi:hypothetical protein